MLTYRVQTDKRNKNVEDVSFKILGKIFQIDLDKGASPKEITQTIDFVRRQFFINRKADKK